MAVYLVNPGARLIRAGSQAQALRYASGTFFTVELAKGDTIADLVMKGTRIEDGRAPENLELLPENGGIATPKPAPAVDSAPAAVSVADDDPLPTDGFIVEEQ